MSIVPAHWPPRNHVIERTREEQKEEQDTGLTMPPLYTVMLVRATETSNDLIADVLSAQFNLRGAKAEAIMREAQDNLHAPIIQLPCDQAQTKAETANAYAAGKAMPKRPLLKFTALRV